MRACEPAKSALTMNRVSTSPARGAELGSTSARSRTYARSSSYSRWMLAWRSARVVRTWSRRSARASSWQLSSVRLMPASVCTQPSCSARAIRLRCGAALMDLGLEAEPLLAEVGGQVADHRQVDRPHDVEVRLPVPRHEDEAQVHAHAHRRDRHAAAKAAVRARGEHGEHEEGPEGAARPLGEHDDQGAEDDVAPGGEGHEPPARDEAAGHHAAHG